MKTTHVNQEVREVVKYFLPSDTEEGIDISYALGYDTDQVTRTQSGNPTANKVRGY